MLFFSLMNISAYCLRLQSENGDPWLKNPCYLGVSVSKHVHCTFISIFSRLLDG